MKDINRLKCIDDNIEEVEGVFVKSSSDLSAQRMHLLSTSLKVSQEIVPVIYDTIQNVLSRLDIQDLKLECYVYNDAEMNASCFSLENNIDIVVTISSGLVNNLNENELAFVIGHEIGHYLFGHLEYIKVKTTENELLDMKISKIYQSQEISADRIGLICSGSVDSSIRAIIKTVSGLNDNFITHNLHSYLHQIQSLKYDDFTYIKHTHPIFPIRAKALILFSMSELYYWWINDDREPPLDANALTKKIRKDLESTTLKNLKNKSKDIVEKFQLWFFVKSFIEDNKLDQDELTFLELYFGKEMATKALKYAKENPRGVIKKYEEFLSQIQYLPFQYIKEMIKQMKNELNNKLPNHNVQKYFNNLSNFIFQNLNIDKTVY